MESRSHFAGLYKKDMSIENLRAKVARRKSITQKENRHKEFRKIRGLSLADVNISVAKEQDLTVLEEVNESYIKAHESIQAGTGKAKEQVTDERRLKLQRFKEEKQLRKLKEQREKAKKGVFKCGIYKGDVSFIPVPVFQNPVKVKQKEKPAAPTVTRITRSAAAREPSVTKPRAQPVPVTVPNKASTDRAITRGRGQALKKNEKENKVSVPPARSTRSTAAPVSKLPTTVKVPLKNTGAATKPGKKMTKEEMVMDKTEPPVIEQSINNCPEPEVALREPAVETIKAETSVLVKERKPSFAPENFVFQPLDGLAPLKFQPMTPNRAHAFLTPSFTWSPMERKRPFVFAREHHQEKEEMEQVSSAELKDTDVRLHPDACSLPSVKECTSDTSSAAAPCTEVTPFIETSANLPVTDSKSFQPEPQHDVPYFRDILKSEIQRLQAMCCDWDHILDADVPEDAKDLIRTTVGQTRLLISERFKQFEGLVDHCEFKTGEKETTCTDLEGFWDMIYFQIEDVCKKFVNLKKLQANSWQQNAVQVKRVVRKKPAPAAAVRQNKDDNGRTAARSRLAAIKAALKHKGKTEDPAPESAASEQPMQVDPVVFDAGFFRIESPAKVLSSLKLRRSSSQSFHTPKSTKKAGPDCPVTNGVQETVEDLQGQKSPSPVQSPVRKALFGTEESLQIQEINPVDTYAECIAPDHTEPESVPPEVDLTKYLVPTENIEVVLKESSSVLECLGLETSLTAQDDCLRGANIDTSMADDVFMCSPQNVVHTTGIDSSPVVSPKIAPDEDLKTSDDPLDFLGRCTPVMVHPAPLMRQSTTASDLMMFSPLEK